MEPALREFHHLITNGKITEDKFCEDMLHRLVLAKQEARREVIEECIDTLYQMPIEVVGNSAQTLDQAISALRSLESKATDKPQ